MSGGLFCAPDEDSWHVARDALLVRDGDLQGSVEVSGRAAADPDVERAGVLYVPSRHRAPVGELARAELEPHRVGLPGSDVDAFEGFHGLSKEDCRLVDGEVGVFELCVGQAVPEGVERCAGFVEVPLARPFRVGRCGEGFPSLMTFENFLKGHLAERHTPDRARVGDN